MFMIDYNWDFGEINREYGLSLKDVIYMRSVVLKTHFENLP